MSQLSRSRSWRSRDTTHARSAGVKSRSSSTPKGYWEGTGGAEFRWGSLPGPRTVCRQGSGGGRPALAVWPIPSGRGEPNQPEGRRHLGRLNVTMNDAAERGEPSGNVGETVAMVLRHISWVPAGTVLPLTAHERLEIQRTALDWQELGTRAEWAEVHGARNGVVEGRTSELCGRGAVLGEQLGLAWTLDQEFQRWSAAGVSAPNDGRDSMATRALAEMCGYYLLGASHGLGNVTVRTLVLSAQACEVLANRRPSASGFIPFSEEKAAWPPLTSKLVRDAAEAAQATGESAARDLVQVLGDLVGDPRWSALVDRRDVDYHRWRPQGLPSGGVPQRSLWDRPEPGTRSLHGGARFFETVDHKALCRTAGEALDAVGETMGKWLDLWPAALQAVGVPVFKTA